MWMKIISTGNTSTDAASSNSFVWIIHFLNMTIYANNIEKIIEIFQCMVLKGVHVYTFFYSIIRW